MSASEQTPTRAGDRRTRYFVVRYSPTGSAAAHIATLIERLDDAATWVLKTLKARRDVALEPRPILVEIVAGPLAGTGEPVERAGTWSNPVDWVLRTTHDEAAPAEELIYHLARLLVRRWARPAEGWNAVEGHPEEHWCYAPTFLADGLARHLATRYVARRGAKLFDLSRRQSADHVAREAAGARDGKLPLYECLMRGPAMAASVPEFHALQESFSGYMFERDGPRRYCTFARDSASEPSLIADLLYGKSLEQLQDEWMHAVLRGMSRRPMTLKAFVRIALPYLRPYWVLILFSLVLMVISAITSLAPQFFLRDAINLLTDALKPGGARLGALDDFIAILLRWAAFNMIAIVTTIILVYTINVIGQNVLRDMRVQFIEHTQQLGSGFYSRTRIGDLVARFTSDIGRLADPMTDALSYSVYYGILLVAAVSAMLLMSWQLSLLLVIVVPVYIFAGRWLGLNLQKAARERQERLAQLNAHLEEMLYGHSLIKIYNLRYHVNRYFKPEIGQYRKVAIWVQYLQSLYAQTLQVVDNFQTKLVIGFGGFLALNEIITPGTVFSFNGLVSRFLYPLGRYSNIYASISQSAASMRRLQEIMREPPERLETPPGGREAPGDVRQGISFEDVCFTYGGPELTVDHITLAIPAGHTVAFVGPTGAGKSTLAGLVPRFYDVTGGAVKIDGEDIRHFSLGGLRSRISIVSQDTFCFNTTIRENIRFGRMDASDEEVEEAARSARLHEFVMSLPSGYDTVVGERGVRLSGGQRQRISIARTMLRNSPIIILDEATSALDAETESEILAELDQVTAGKTVITITHRLALAMRADTICVLQAGRILEQGTHRELMERRGLYHRLFEEQNEQLLESGANEQLDRTVQQLRSVPVFSLLPVQAVEPMSHLLVSQRFAPGDIISGASDKRDTLYLLRDGEVEIVTHDDKTGEGHRTSIQTSEDLTGHGGMAVLLNLPEGVIGRAVTPLLVDVLDSASMRRLLSNGDGHQPKPELRRQDEDEDQAPATVGA
ncbi:MAG: ATP-binding cassette domain-containing protein [Chloroflexi bacterium]|nr:ATP-binding cassette domain-containing protein [Chloroflexota bacterium]